MNQPLSSIKTGWKNFGTSAKWIFLVRLALAAIFIGASIHKIAEPAAFADIIHHYQLLPAVLIPWVAVIQPWLELLVAVLLIFGFWLPGAVALLNLLLCLFTGAILINTLRGLNIDCGCFESSLSLVDRTTMLLYLLRNSFFLIIGFYLAWYLIKMEEKDEGGRRKDESRS